MNVIVKVWIARLLAMQHYLEERPEKLSPGELAELDLNLEALLSQVRRLQKEKSIATNVQ